MTNLPKNPKPQYADKKEEILEEKPTMVSNAKVVDELVRIIKKSKKLEERLKVNENEAIFR